MLIRSKPEETKGRWRLFPHKLVFPPTSRSAMISVYPLRLPIAPEETSETTDVLRTRS
jgi:hypothetical protein